jgi:hypothetical protein
VISYPHPSLSLRALRERVRVRERRARGIRKKAILTTKNAKNTKFRIAV